MAKLHDFAGQKRNVQNANGRVERDSEVGARFCNILFKSLTNKSASTLFTSYEIFLPQTTAESGHLHVPSTNKIRPITVRTTAHKYITNSEWTILVFSKTAS